MIDVVGDFILDDSLLNLSGGPNDAFVFNISADAEFKVNSDAEIRLLGSLSAMDVLFNIEGVVGGGGPDDVIVQESLIHGTLLAPGRNVLINDNEFGEGHGIHGAVVAGGKLIFEESDITHEPFVFVPEPNTFLLTALAGIIALCRRRRPIS